MMRLIKLISICILALILFSGCTNQNAAHVGNRIGKVLGGCPRIGVKNRPTKTLTIKTRLDISYSRHEMTVNSYNIQLLKV